MSTLRRWIARHPLTAGTTLIAVLVVGGLAVAAQAVGWPALWASPDQRGAWQMRHGRYAAAAAAFADPVWRGIALMRVGRFAEAADSFAAAATPEAAYDRGNALVMLGKYAEAVGGYDRALALRPGWPDALANRALAQARAARLVHQDGAAADEDQTAPEEAYRRDRPRDAADQTAAPASVMTDAAIRSLWLRRVQSRPADFLRARFAFQLQATAQSGAPAP